MSDLVLAIETSCDETAAAVVEGRAIRSNVIASQADLHAVYGGVVPEVAARHHLTTVNAVVDEALDRAGVDLVEVDRIAVTRRPGNRPCMWTSFSTSSMSSGAAASITPQRARKADEAAASPASAAVCVLAAVCEAAVLPALMAIMDLPMAAASSAMAAKSTGSMMPSI